MKQLGAGWRLGFWICGFAFFLLAILLGKTAFPRRKEIGKGDRQSKTPRYSYWQLGMLLSFFIAIVLYVGLENGFGYFANLLFGAYLGQAEFGAMAISAYWAGMATSRFLCGLKTYHPEKMLLTCFLISAILFVALVMLGNPGLSVLICFFLGAAFGLVWGTLVALAGGISPENSAGVIGFMSTGCGLGGIVYPVLMGTLSETFSLKTAFLCLAATAFAGFLICCGAVVMEGIKSRQKGKERVYGRQ